MGKGQVRKRHNRSSLERVCLAAGALACTVGLATAPTAAAESTVLILGGTGEPDPGALPIYLQHMEQYYINPFGPCTAAMSCNYQAVVTPEQFWPVPGWYDPSSPLTFGQSSEQGTTDLESTLTALSPGQKVIVFGYSQSSTISGFVMRDVQDGKVTPPAGTDLSFVLIGNPSRPNGGILERFDGSYIPGLDVSFSGATPTSAYPTTDVAFQYDGFADFPEYPINVLADANAIAGMYYLHGTYPGVDPADSSPPPGGNPDGLTPAQLAAAEADPANVQHHGATTYVTIPATTLPIVEPLLQLGAATGTSRLIVPLVDLVQPMLRTLIEIGYDRTDYGVPTAARLLPPINPLTLATDLVHDVQQGVTDAVSNLGNGTPVPLPSMTPAPSPVSSVLPAQPNVLETKVSPSTTASRSHHGLVRQALKAVRAVAHGSQREKGLHRLRPAHRAPPVG